MNLKQNQIIAICDGTKSRYQKIISELHHQLQRNELITGMTRTYQPVNDEDEKFPDEGKLVQITTKESLEILRKSLIELIDLVGTQEKTNTIAYADIIIDDQIIAKDVPVTVLLFLEKKCKDVQTFLEKLIELDPVEEWEYDKNISCYKSKPKQTAKTKKVPRNHVKAEATKEHPAQVEVFTEDVVVGYWTTTKMSGAVPKEEKTALLKRITLLQESIKIAREEANNTEVTKVTYGDALLKYLLK